MVDSWQNEDFMLKHIQQLLLIQVLTKVASMEQRTLKKM